MTANNPLNIRAGVKGFVTRPLADRFWSKVDRSAGGDCWEWTGGTRSPNRGRAYGLIWRDGRHVPASKVAWELHNWQPFPEGMDALHTCDNPPCVNPHHIFPGTPSDNARDMSRKGRHRSGSTNEPSGFGHRGKGTPRHRYQDYPRERVCTVCGHRAPLR